MGVRTGCRPRTACQEDWVATPRIAHLRRPGRDYSDVSGWSHCPYSCSVPGGTLVGRDNVLSSSLCFGGLVLTRHRKRRQWVKMEVPYMDPFGGLVAAVGSHLE